MHAGPDDRPEPVGRRWGEVVSLSVLPAERGAGVGSALLDAADHELAARDVPDLQAAVAENADALRFYERRGLHPAELRLSASARPRMATRDGWTRCWSSAAWSRREAARRR